MVASHQSNSFMKLEIGFWCNAMPVTSILENKSYSVRKMDLGRIECLPASVIEIEKWKILSTISQLLYDNFSIQNGNFDEKINVLLLLTEKIFYIGGFQDGKYKLQTNWLESPEKKSCNSLLYSERSQLQLLKRS